MSHRDDHPGPTSSTTGVPGPTTTLLPGQSPPGSNPVASDYIAQAESQVGYEDPDDPFVWARMPDADAEGPGWVTGRFRASAVLASIYDWTDEEYLSFQQRAYAAGLYPGKSRPNYTNRYDPATMTAWKGVVESAVMAYREGKGAKVTPHEIVDSALAGDDGQDSGPAPVIAGGIVAGGQAHIISLQDPAALRKVAEQVGIAVIGKKPSKEQVDRIVATLTSAEKAEADRANTARDAQDQREFGARVNANNSQAQAQATPVAGRHQLISPVPGAKIADSLGAPRDEGTRKHKGTDIFGKTGSPAVAPIGGVVTRAGSGGPKAGNRVWIKGDDGRYHFLAHLHTIGVKPGDRVEQGAQIGTVGYTGNASPKSPHVHYSINSSDTKEDAIANPAVELKGGEAPAEIRSVPNTYIPPTTTTITNVNAEARAEEAIRAENPEEAKAHDLATTYGKFMNVIFGQERRIG